MAAVPLLVGDEHVPRAELTPQCAERRAGAERRFDRQPEASGWCRADARLHNPRVVVPRNCAAGVRRRTRAPDRFVCSWLRRGRRHRRRVVRSGVRRQPTHDVVRLRRDGRLPRFHYGVKMRRASLDFDDEVIAGAVPIRAVRIRASGARPESGAGRRNRNCADARASRCPGLAAPAVPGHRLQLPGIV